MAFWSGKKAIGKLKQGYAKVQEFRENQREKAVVNAKRDAELYNARAKAESARGRYERARRSAAPPNPFGSASSSFMMGGFGQPSRPARQYKRPKKRSTGTKYVVVGGVAYPTTRATSRSRRRSRPRLPPKPKGIGGLDYL